MSPTRRAYLGAGLGVSLTALAGCAGQSESGSPETDAPTGSRRNRGPFEELSFDGGDLVVGLAPTHGLSGVNLIAPDGTIFEQVSVATGVETIRIPVLDPQPDDGGYRHYTPGVHKLVGVNATGDEVASRTVPMQPEIRIVGIEQYRSGNRPSDFGSLVVTVENTGTAPTWVYDITYRDAPNFAANTKLGANPGILSVRSASDLDSVLIPPDDFNSYTDATTPLLFRRENIAECSGSVEFSVLLATAVGVVLEVVASGEVNGEILPAGLVDEYACSEVTLGLVSGDPESIAKETTADES